MCFDATLQREVDAIALFFSQLIEDQCPASALAPTTSKFFAQVRELAEGFLTTSAVTKVDLENKTCLVHGKAAMELLYKDFDDKDGDIETEQLIRLKTFQWILTEEQRKKKGDRENQRKHSAGAQPAHHPEGYHRPASKRS